LIIALMALPACSKTPAADAAAASTPQPAGAPSALPAGAALSAQALSGQEAVKPVPADLPEVIARVNGETITKIDFERAVQSLEGRAGQPVPPAQRDTVYRGILDELVGYRLLTQEAAMRKVTVPDADVSAQIAQIQGQFPTPEAFTKVLAERNVTIEQVRADTRRDMLVAKLLRDEIDAKTAVTPEQVTDFYTKNPDQFKQPERVRASHILISAAKDADVATKAQARAKAEAVLKDVKAGKDFAALAKQHSQDPGSAVQGGDLGFFTQGQMVGPFNDAAFSLAPGATSDLVETDFGFHIIRVVDKQTGRTVPLDEVKTKVEEYLRNQNRRLQTDAFVGGLKAKGKIELFI
jgi:peptidyl-prolyl cis-trans isomerase C